VLDAAVVRFGREGYWATSVARIARDAGVSGSVAYAYFDDKEDLFLSALDQDASAVIADGMAVVADRAGRPAWRRDLMVALVTSLDDHLLARRVLANLEPHVTDRVADIPALVELRTAVGERLAAEQRSGLVRPDIDPMVVGSGLVAITLSLLMSTLQVGDRITGAYADRILVPADAVLPKPDAITWEEGAGLLLTGATAVHALTAAAVGEGDTVLVHAAAGGVGQMAMQLAVVRGDEHGRAARVDLAEQVHDLERQIRIEVPGRPRGLGGEGEPPRPGRHVERPERRPVTAGDHLAAP
jgi:AcrR family transcriptional regulator